jgi:NADP-dependent 3-hydroxy acid dehydrogenase YdfG
MISETVTLQVPEIIYQRLVDTANATKRPLEEVILHALKVGSPPAWDDIPEEFQAEIAALDKLDDNALWQIARSHKTEAEMNRYNTLLEINSQGKVTDTERIELAELRYEADLFMLRKAQSAVLLRWRGYNVPNS